MACVHVLACLPDNAFKLYFDDPQEFERRVAEMLEGQAGDPTWRHTKAVDKQTGKLVAWASWNTPKDAQIRERDTKAASKAVATRQGNEIGGFDFPPGLPTYVREDTDRWLDRWTRRKRHILCKALFTDPHYQRRGIATALVKHGAALADDLGLPTFLQASPYGFPIYERYGFETVQHLDVDLCQWAPKAALGDKGFGNYRFRYMLRLPMTVPPANV